MQLDWTADSERIISCSADRHLKLWRLSTGGCEHTFNSHQDYVYGCKFTLDGRKAASCEFESESERGGGGGGGGEQFYSSFATRPSLPSTSHSNTPPLQVGRTDK